MHHRALIAAGCATAAIVALAPLPSLGQDGGPPGRGRGAAAPTGTEQFVERLMRNDANGDGTLSAEELPGRMGERLLESADQNDDGLLDRKELTAYAESRAAGAGRDGRNGRGGRGDGEGGFDSHMRRAGAALRELSDSSFDAASLASDLRGINALQAGLVGAKARLETATMGEAAKKHFGEDTAAYHRAFRLQLIRTLHEALAVERALAEGDTDEAKAAFARLRASQQEGHDRFKD